MAGRMLKKTRRELFEPDVTLRRNLLHKIHAYDAGDSPVCPRITNVTPIVWETPPDIMKHAPTDSKNTHTPPPGEVVECV